MSINYNLKKQWNIPCKAALIRPQESVTQMTAMNDAYYK